MITSFDQEHKYMKKKKKRDIYCGNCGKLGHVYKQCREPITSCGVIGYKIFEQNIYNINDSSFKLLEHINEENQNIKNIIKYLIVQRRDSVAYVEILRGKYEDTDIKLILKLFSEMTNTERIKLNTDTFKNLWNNLWINHEHKSYKNEFLQAQEKFSKLKRGYSVYENKISIELAIKNTKSNLQEPEWGFPKGRRNMKEKNLKCAEREFREETGLKLEEYRLIENYPCVEEVFKGSNDIFYKHIYYLSEINIDRTLKISSKNKNQYGEIGNIKWVTFDEIIKKFNRPNQTTRINLIKNINNFLLNQISM
jgi:8-oxo-dGTP pyrophosphatase MutT (NUDIX family)